MNAIKLENKKIQTMGEYHYISIPKALIDHSILSIEKEYDITLKEAKTSQKLHQEESTALEGSS